MVAGSHIDVRRSLLSEVNVRFTRNKIFSNFAAMRESEALMKEADFASRFRNKLDARSVWLLRP